MIIKETWKTINSVIIGRCKSSTQQSKFKAENGEESIPDP